MRIEGFKATPPENKDEEASVLEQNILENRESFNFETSLGEGFGNEFFADKMMTFPHDKMFKHWNEFLLREPDRELHDRLIEQNIFFSVISKLSGNSDAPVMFPVFVQGLQTIYEQRGIPSDHVTPERLERFYADISGSV